MNSNVINGKCYYGQDITCKYLAAGNGAVCNQCPWEVVNGVAVLKSTAIVVPPPTTPPANRIEPGAGESWYTSQPAPTTGYKKDIRIFPEDEGGDSLHITCPFPEDWEKQNKECKLSCKSKYTGHCQYNRAMLISNWCDNSQPKEK